MKRELVTSATAGPVTILEVRDWLVIEDNTDDSLLGLLIDRATGYAEDYMRRSVSTQTWVYYFDSFASALYIGSPPISAIVIKYDDADDVEQTLDSGEYYADLKATNASIVPVNGWPVTKDKPNAVRVEVTAGYSGDVPEAIKTGILLMIAHFYEDREGSAPVPDSAHMFFDKHRVVF